MYIVQYLKFGLIHFHTPPKPNQTQWNLPRDVNTFKDLMPFQTVVNFLQHSQTYYLIQ